MDDKIKQIAERLADCVMYWNLQQKTLPAIVISLPKNTVWQKQENMIFSKYAAKDST